MQDLLKNKKISLSGSGITDQNMGSEQKIKTVVTIYATMIIHASPICPEDTLSTDLCKISMDYYLLIYICIPNMQSSIYVTGIFSSSRSDTVSETISNCRVWGF